jgi:hypothetical protein
MNAYRFNHDPHFIQRVALRDISTEECKALVRSGSGKKLVGKGFHATRYTFEKTVDETTLFVVAEIKNNECWLITAYYKDKP